VKYAHAKHAFRAPLVLWGRRSRNLRLRGLLLFRPHPQVNPAIDLVLAHTDAAIADQLQQSKEQPDHL
jgi:hypothetical protein